MHGDSNVSTSLTPMVDRTVTSIMTSMKSIHCYHRSLTYNIDRDKSDVKCNHCIALHQRITYNSDFTQLRRERRRRKFDVRDANTQSKLTSKMPIQSPN